MKQNIDFNSLSFSGGFFTMIQALNELEIISPAYSSSPQNSNNYKPFLFNLYFYDNLKVNLFFSFIAILIMLLVELIRDH